MNKKALMIITALIAIVILAAPLVGIVSAGGLPIPLPGQARIADVELLRTADGWTDTIRRKDRIMGMTWTGECDFELEEPYSREFYGEITLEITNYVYDRVTGRASIVLKVTIDFDTQGMIKGIIQVMSLPTPIPGPGIDPISSLPTPIPGPATMFKLYSGKGIFKGVTVNGQGDLTFAEALGGSAFMNNFEGRAIIPKDFEWE